MLLQTADLANVCSVRCPQRKTTSRLGQVSSGCAEDSAHYSWRRRAVSLAAVLLPRETAEQKHAQHDKQNIRSPDE